MNSAKTESIADRDDTKQLDEPINYLELLNYIRSEVGGGTLLLAQILRGLWHGENRGSFRPTYTS